jgi:hypothetical protein
MSSRSISRPTPRTSSRPTSRKDGPARRVPDVWPLPVAATAVASTLTTAPTTSVDGGSTRASRAAAAIFPSVARTTCCWDVVARETIAAGQAEPRDDARRSAMTSSCAGIRTTSVSTLAASRSRSAGRPSTLCPVTIATDPDTARYVTGMSAASGAASAALTPGMTRTGIPARRSALTSSPPRPKRNGSPPFRRTTRSPARAAAIIASLIFDCEVDGRPARLPTLTIRARAPHRRRAPGSTSASCRTRSASASTARVAIVTSSGSPGPAPASTTSPIGAASPACRAECSMARARDCAEPVSPSRSIARVSECSRRR